MKKELVHFVEWKRIPEDKVFSVMEEIVQWGVKNIVAHPCFFKEDDPSYIRKIATYMENAGLKSTACHALWGKGNDCVITDEDVWKEMIRKHKNFLDQLSVLGVKTYTYHLGVAHEEKWENIASYVRKSVDALLPVCERNQIILALENSGETPDLIRKMSDFVTEYSHPYLGMCFDSGHANCYQDGIRETLEVMRNNIVTCHLHDNYGSFDDHNPPGGGNTDWNELDALLDTLPRLLHAETESGDWGEEAWYEFCKALKKA